MKRPIKFRAWDSKDKMWLLAFMLHHDTGKIVGINHAYKNIHLMQYTGLKDKNGTEIYEGDILETPYDTFAVDDILPLRKDFWHKDDSDWWSYPEEVKVIGNIYENPDLLGKGE